MVDGYRARRRNYTYLGRRTLCFIIYSAVTIIEIEIEIAIFHGDRMGSKSRSFLFDLCRFSLGDGQRV